jgi:intracellular septation protein A
MTAPKQENPWLNLVFNLILPSFILMKGEAWFQWSPVKALVIALSLPLMYGVYDLVARKTWNTLSIIGLISILLTGGIGLLELPTQWIAVKEAAIPTLLGLIVLGSLKTRYPLVKTFIFNKQFFEVEKIETTLGQKQQLKALDHILTKATIGLAGSFFLSGLLNFLLAKWIVHSPTGTQAFTEELGKMALLSYPVIVLPSMVVLVAIFWWLLKNLQSLTGFPMEELFISPPPKK